MANDSFHRSTHFQAYFLYIVTISNPNTKFTVNNNNISAPDSLFLPSSRFSDIIQLNLSFCLVNGVMMNIDHAHRSKPYKSQLSTPRLCWRRKIARPNYRLLSIKAEKRVNALVVWDEVRHWRDYSAI